MHRGEEAGSAFLSLMRKIALITLLLLCFTTLTAQTYTPPKREFRGSWIQIINGQFQGLGTAGIQANLTQQLNALQQAGVNVVLFQVRGEADAFYASPYEPWSRFLTGRQGQAPTPYWDPLEWMVQECHRRGMELHAWINPFRAKTKTTKELAATHLYFREPHRFFAYDGLLLFDPALPENRSYICQVAADIVRRYDIDGLHIDDYFYPYPAAGVSIPDEVSFARYGRGYADRGDWRRDNVNLFIKQLHDTIRSVKPWVKFGVSPFGIYHNRKAGSNVPGSETAGLQNYDDLYADVLLWLEKGWVDYNIPQLYWEVGHKVADYERLVHWWARHAAARPLIIGQDVERTVRAKDTQQPSQNQLAEKMRIVHSEPSIVGNCFWYSAALARNEGGYTTALATHYQRTPALQPRMPFIDAKAPKKPRKVKVLEMPDAPYLFWTAPKAKHQLDKAVTYAVYRFAKGEKVDLENATHLIALTQETMFRLPYEGGQQQYTYIVTALDRLHNESKAVKKKIKL